MSDFNTTQEECVEDSMKHRLTFSIGSPLSSCSTFSHNFSDTPPPLSLLTSSPLPTIEGSFGSEGRLVSLSKFLSSSTENSTTQTTFNGSLIRSQLSLVIKEDGFDEEDNFLSSPPPFSLPTSSIGGGGGSIAAFSTQPDEETISNKFTISPIVLPFKDARNIPSNETIIPATYPDNNDITITECPVDDLHSSLSADTCNSIYESDTINRINQKEIQIGDIVWAPWRYDRWAPAKVIKKARRGKLITNFLHHHNNKIPKSLISSHSDLCIIDVREGDIVYYLMDRRKLKYEKVVVLQAVLDRKVLVEAKNKKIEISLEMVIIGRGEFIDFVKRSKEIDSKNFFTSSRTVDEEEVQFCSLISKILSPHKKWNDLKGNKIIITSHQKDCTIDRSKITNYYSNNSYNADASTTVCIVMYGKKINSSFTSKSCKYFLSLMYGYPIYKCMMSSIDVLEPLISYKNCRNDFINRYQIISYQSYNGDNPIYKKWISIFEDIYHSSILDVENCLSLCDWRMNDKEGRKIFIFSINDKRIPPSRILRMFMKKESISIIGSDALFRLVTEINK